MRCDHIESPPATTYAMSWQDMHVLWRRAIDVKTQKMGSKSAITFLV